MQKIAAQSYELLQRLRNEFEELTAAQSGGFTALEKALREIIQTVGKENREQVESVTLLQQTLDSSLARLIVLEEKTKSQEATIQQFQDAQQKLTQLNDQMERQLRNYRENVVKKLEELSEQNGNSARLWRQKAEQTEEEYNRLHTESEKALTEARKEIKALKQLLQQHADQGTALEKAKLDIVDEIADMRRRFSAKEAGYVAEIKGLKTQLFEKDAETLELQQRIDRIQVQLKGKLEAQTVRQQRLEDQFRQYRDTRETDQDASLQNSYNDARPRENTTVKFLPDRVFNQIQAALLEEEQLKTEASRKFKSSLLERQQRQQQLLDRDLAEASRRIKEFERRSVEKE